MATNRLCPECQAPLRSMDAKQCFVCGHDWHREQEEDARASDPFRKHRLIAIVWAFAGVGLTGWTIYLLQDGFNWWAVLTGLIASAAWVGVVLFFVLDSESFESLLQISTGVERAKREWEQERLKQERAAEREKRKQKRAIQARGPAGSVAELFLKECPHCLVRTEREFSDYLEQTVCKQCGKAVD